MVELFGVHQNTQKVTERKENEIFIQKNTAVACVFPGRFYFISFLFKVYYIYLLILCSTVVEPSAFFVFCGMFACFLHRTG